MKDKKSIRAVYSQKRNELSFEFKNEFDKFLFEKTVNCDEFKRADVILAFYPIKNEPDVLPIVRYALNNGKKVCFPVSDADNYQLTFKFIKHLSDLVTGAYKIPEPNSEAEIFTDDKNAFCIVPGLVYDRNGYRIGYGKGFYDRFLAEFSGISAGLCYEIFLCNELPIEVTDRNVDMIITEREVLYIEK